MAHIEKFKKSSVAGMMHHYKRDRQATLDRENVDESRTHLNYTLGAAAGLEAVEQRIKAVQEATGKAVRRDANVMASVVVTKPQNVPEGDERAFFEACYEWLSAKLGPGNVLGGFVHLDESTPHMHFAFTPIKDNRFNFNKVCPRSFYQTMHKEMSDYVEQRLGYKADILLDNEKQGDKQLSHLSQDEYVAAKDRLESLRQREDELRDEISTLQSSKETIAESTRYLAKHRGDGERVDQLRERIGDCRARIAECKDGIESAARARRESEGRVGRIEGLRASIEGRCRELEAHVADLVEKVKARGERIIWNCTELGQSILSKLGFDARCDPPSLEFLLDEVMEYDRGYYPPSINRDEWSR